MKLVNKKSRNDNLHSILGVNAFYIASICTYVRAHTKKVQDFFENFRFFFFLRNSQSRCENFSYFVLRNFHFSFLLNTISCLKSEQEREKERGCKEMGKENYIAMYNFFLIVHLFLLIVCVQL